MFKQISFGESAKYGWFPRGCDIISKTKGTPVSSMQLALYLAHASKHTRMEVLLAIGTVLVLFAGNFQMLASWHIATSILDILLVNLAKLLLPFASEIQ